MPTPTPTPYRNIRSDIENEEANASHLEEGLADAHARLKIASEQYRAKPGIPEEEIRNKAAKEVEDRTNAVVRAKNRAKELEIQQKMKGAPKVKTKDSVDEEGNPVIQFPEMLLQNEQPSRNLASSAMDLLKMGANSVMPSAEAASVAATPNTSGFHPPMMLPEQAAQNVASSVLGLRNAGVGKIGDKAQIDTKNNQKIKDAKDYLIGRQEVEDIGGAFRSTPEWQRQERGLDDLEQLIGFQAQANAGKNSVDLSPLGAYLDYQNTLRGKPTNLAQSLKMAPVGDSSIKDMAEVQRRRADMSKEMINAIKAAKVGQIVTENGQYLGTIGGIQVPRPSSSTGQASLDSRNWMNAVREKHRLFDKPDVALNALNTVVRELGDQIPSDMNRLKIQKAMIDMNGMRPALAEVMMEGGNQTLMNRLQAVWDRNIAKGTSVTTQDVEEFWHSARAALKAMKYDRLQRAQQLRATVSELGVDESRFDKLASPQYIDRGYTSHLEGELPEKAPKGTYNTEKDAPKNKNSNKMGREQMLEAMKKVNRGG